MSQNSGADRLILPPKQKAHMLHQRIKMMDYPKVQKVKFPRDEQDDIAHKDRIWLTKFEKIVRSNLSDTQFTMDFVANHMNMSRRQIQRRLHALTGTTPRAYIIEMRLQAARTKLELRAMKTINQVAHAAGYLDAAYFSKLFKKRFGVTPTDYRRNRTTKRAIQ